MRNTGGGGSRITADDQLADGRVDRDAALASLDAAGHRIGGRDRLAAGSVQSRGKRLDAGVAGTEAVVGGQDGLAVAAGEVHRTCIAAGGVAVRVVGRDGDVA